MGREKKEEGEITEDRKKEKRGRKLEGLWKEKGVVKVRNMRTAEGNCEAEKNEAVKRNGKRVKKKWKGKQRR